MEKRGRGRGRKVEVEVLKTLHFYIKENRKLFYKRVVFKDIIYCSFIFFAYLFSIVYLWEF